MRRRRTFLIVFAFLLIILLVGVGALWLMSQRGGGGTGQEPVGDGDGDGEPIVQPTPEPEMESVVVVVQPVRRGQRIPPDAVELRRWEIDRLPSDPVYNLEDVVGALAAVDLRPPQPLRASEVKTVVLYGSDMSLAIPAGKVAYSFPVRLISAVAGALRPGDYVDVLISWSVVEVDQDLQLALPLMYQCPEDALTECRVIPPEGGQIPGLVSGYTVQRAQVMGVGLLQEEEAGVQVEQPEGAEGEPVIPIAEGEGEAAAQEAPPPEAAVPPLSQVTVVTLAVEPYQALVLKWAYESKSSIDLVMRSAADLEEFSQPEAVTLDYMIRRYSISPPTRLPYGLRNDFQYPLIDGYEEFVTGATTGE